MERTITLCYGLILPTENKEEASFHLPNTLPKSSLLANDMT